MAEKYSDIIELRQQKAAFEIKDDSDWQSFITTDDFNKMLSKSIIPSVIKSDTNSHKPFWIRGAYGTGKSHAASVLKHLLCDNPEDILAFINREYDGKPLKEQIQNLRQTKRLFPVMLYGQENIATENALGAVLQSRITSTLKAEGIDISVKTDYDRYADSISKDPVFWQDHIIDKNPELKSYTPDTQSLKARLQQYDTAIFELVCMTISQSIYDIKIDNAKIADWIFDVQAEVRNHGYDGLLIIWDEFTTLIKSSSGSALLVCIQEIAEKMQSINNDTYFLLISHPSALDNLESQEQNKITGRFYMFNYTMEEFSAYRIMSSKFGRKTSEDITGGFFENNATLLRHFTNGDVFEEATINDIKKLFPLHPYTAYLASVYAMQAGSSSRSVFEFIGNHDIRDFLDNPENFAKHRTITADYLWDDVFDEFRQHTDKFGAVVQCFQQNNIPVKQAGESYSAVFKSILLLNALNNLGNGDAPKLLPNEDNIKLVFKKTEIEQEINTILSYFNDHGIIVRNPDGIYSIRFTDLPSQELEKEKFRLSEVEFKHIEKVATYGDIAKNAFQNMVERQIQRPCQMNFYSIDSDFYLQERIRKVRKNAKPWEVVIAAFFALNNHDIGVLKDFIDKSSKEDRLKNTLFVVYDTPLTEKDYHRFVDYQAVKTVAHNLNRKEQEEDGIKNSKKIVEDWMTKCKNGQIFFAINGDFQTNSAGNLARIVNSVIVPNVMFTSGIETIESVRIKDTFWNLVTPQKDYILSFSTRSEIKSKLPGAAKPFEQFVMQDCVDENLNFLPDCSPKHPLKQICDFVQKQLDKTAKNEQFNLADKLSALQAAPFGLYPSYPCCLAVSFAMRPYIGKIFDPNGVPQNANHLQEVVRNLFDYWDKNKNYNKLDLRMETEESNSLYQELVQLFGFDTNEFKSLRYLRWTIRKYTHSKGYPLWALKYAFEEKDNINDDMKKAVDNLITMCHSNDRLDQNMIVETLEIIKKRRQELLSYINSKTEESMRKGYLVYLKSIPLVNLQDEEFEQAAVYIKNNMHGEEGDWAEDEVKTALLSWREDTSKPKEQPQQPIVQHPQQFEQTPVEPANEPIKSFTPKRETARQKVRNHNNIDTLKTVLEKLIDTIGDETIIDDIINQL